MGNASHLAALMLLFGAATADAQTPVTGAYQQLSAPNQKIARALFEAQVHPTTTTTTSAARTMTSSLKPLTLDQIASIRQNGTGWTDVFKQMHTQGLVTDKSLSQVVSRYNETHPAPAASTVTTAANRPVSANVARGQNKSDETSSATDPYTSPR
jgi:hypothetical protein